MKVYLLLILVAFGFHTAAQNCGNCKVTPVLATYDFEIKVPAVKPGAEGWLEYLQLYWLASHTNGYLFTNYKNCVRFVVSPEMGDDLDDDYDIEKIGLKHIRLPHHDYKENYITTGTVTQTASGFQLQVRLLAACSRKIINTVNVSFNRSSSSDYIRGIAHQAAAKLDILNSIKKYELEERKSNTSFAPGGFDKDRIILTPAKRKLQKGETTDVSIELKDCDGEPLAGRVIVFSGKKGSNNMFGTVGGIVTPSTITTDASGKATVKFQMTAAPGTPAVINAYTTTATSLSCNDAFIGSVQIDPGTAIKLVINVEKKKSESLSMDSNEDGVAFKAASSRLLNLNYSMHAFYYPAKPSIDNTQIIIIPDEVTKGETAQKEETNNDDIPTLEPYLSKATNDGKAVMYYFGYSGYTGSDKGMHLVASPVGAPPAAPETSENIDSYRPIAPTISFLFKNKELVFFSVSVDFKVNDESGSLMDAGIGIEISNKKYFPLKAEKIADPNSPYRSKYTLVYEERSNMGSGKIIKQANSDYEKATIVIYTPF